MATIARTEEMFMRAPAVETTVENKWDGFTRFVARILMPSWVVAYAEELAADQRSREQS